MKELTKLFRDQLKDTILLGVSHKISPTREGDIPKFSIYHDVLLMEYACSYTYDKLKSEVITIGFTQDHEVHILLFNSSIEAIKENSTAVINGDYKDTPDGKKKIKLINPIVFSFRLGEKRSFRLHPDRGHFIDATLLQGKFFHAVFDLILKNGNAILQKFEKITVAQ